MDSHAWPNRCFFCHDVVPPLNVSSPCMKHSSSDSKSLEKCDCQILARNCCGACHTKLLSSARLLSGTSSIIQNQSCGQQPQQGICPCSNSHRCCVFSAPNLDHSCAHIENKYLFGSDSRKVDHAQQNCKCKADSAIQSSATNFCFCFKPSAPTLAQDYQHGVFLPASQHAHVQLHPACVPTVGNCSNFGITIPLDCSNCTSKFFSIPTSRSILIQFLWLPTHTRLPRPG